MIEIEGKIVSSQIFDRKFVCNLKACKGICCVEGDSGAPLDDEEIKLMSIVFEEAKSCMDAEGIRAIEKQGAWIRDEDGDAVTPLVDGRQCAYVIFEDGIASCAIEKAWKNGLTSFRKPISCHLYPIRINKTARIEALNYDEWKVCAPACAKGEQLNVPVYVFLKEPIVRKYGEAFYAMLENAALLWEDEKKKG